jgi:hypothetical protein
MSNIYDMADAWFDTPFISAPSTGDIDLTVCAGR